MVVGTCMGFLMGAQWVHDRVKSYKIHSIAEKILIAGGALSGAIIGRILLGTPGFVIDRTIDKTAEAFMKIIVTAYLVGLHGVPPIFFLVWSPSDLFSRIEK